MMAIPNVNMHQCTNTPSVWISPYGLEALVDGPLDDIVDFDISLSFLWICPILPIIPMNYK